MGLWVLGHGGRSLDHFPGLVRIFAASIEAARKRNVDHGFWCKYAGFISSTL